MKFITYRLCFFLLLASVYLTQAQDQVTLTWDETSPLSWDMFQGAINNNSKAVALTASGLTFGYTFEQTNRNIVSFKAKVYAHFYPHNSWVKPDSKTTYILGHEQLHFDITELYARMFRKELSGLRISNNLKQRIEEIHRRINMDLDKMQNLYDTESNHSINEEAQLRWEREVKEALDALSDYASPNVYVTG